MGEFARRQAAEVPDRTVGAAKSWLAYSRVDRHQPILPWGAPASVAKISPVTASQRYLEHMVAAWEAAFPDAPVAEQIVVLTVPASFDASARELTREAALAAGLPQDLVLLEEPQAAVYAWLADRGDRWRRALELGDTLLVCDVGGGTTDLTLVTVAEEEGELVLRRMAVGNHLLVGGDNMDLALAHFVAGRFAEKGREARPVAIGRPVAFLPQGQGNAAGRRRRGRRQVSDRRAGPRQPPDRRHGHDRGRSRERRPTAGRRLLSALQAERPAGAAAAAGFRELGLPYEADTAITRHLAAFLQAHGAAAGRAGAADARAVQRRRVQGRRAARPAAGRAGRVVRRRSRAARCSKAGTTWIMPWPAARPITAGRSIAAACGSAAARPGRITSASRRPAWPCPAPRGRLRALCVVPIGMEEGTEADVPSDEIGLVVGEPAQFRFFSSSTRKEDRPGDLLSSWTPDELEETDSLEATLPAAEGMAEDYVPVRFHSRITELGVLELWCVGTNDSGRWKLEFSVREE